MRIQLSNFLQTQCLFVRNVKDAFLLYSQFDNSKNNRMNILKILRLKQNMKIIIYVRENNGSVPKWISGGIDITAEHIHMNEDT